MSVSLPSTFNLTYKGDGAALPSTHTNIPDVTDFDEGTRTADQVDATDYDSANDAEETEAGIIRSSPGSLVMNYNPGNTVHEDLLGSIGKRIELKATTATRLATMTVLVLGASAPTGAPGTMRKLTLSIKLTGPVVRSVAP